VNDTVCLNPPAGAIAIVYFAVPPGETVAVDEPEEAMEKSSPLPVSVITWGLLPALSTTVGVPFRVPPAVGSKNTPIEQLAPGASELPHVLRAAKSEGPTATLVIVMVVIVKLVSWAFCGRPEVPTNWLGKLSVGGDNVALLEVPVPVTGTASGAVFRRTFAAAFRVPVWLGEKLKFTVQLLLAARAAQLLLPTEKSPALAPVMLMLDRSKVSFPVFNRLKLPGTTDPTCTRPQFRVLGNAVSAGKFP
jgi:hypothetical protein